jgi:hypothetical protein
VSVPTTLQGTHDGCGGTVIFRPVDHRAQLLAGETVVLSALCETCGATLNTSWRLPGAATAPPPPERPVANLGDWQLHSGSLSGDPHRPATGAAAAHDPAIRQHLERFSSRVESARAQLQQASAELPSVVQPGEGFRRPTLLRRTELGAPALSSTPTALRSADPGPLEAAPAPSPVDAPTAPVPAEAAIETAIATPSFHHDSTVPIAFAAAAPAEQPAAPPAPVTQPAPPAPVPQPAPPAPAPTIAPTDVDVFPQAAPALARTVAAASKPAPAAPMMLATPAAPAMPVHVDPDAAAGVWGATPGALAAPVASAAPAMPASPVATAMPQTTPSEPQPAAFGAGEAASVTSELDAAALVGADRGFDWGPDSESLAMPRKRPRFSRRRRDIAAADPAAGPEVVFEPSPDPDLAEPARPRARIGWASLVAVAVLAAVGAYAGVQVMTTDVTSPATTAGTSQPLTVPPAEGVVPVDGSAPAALTAPPAPAEASGNAVADDGVGDAAAALAGQGTDPGGAASQLQDAQVPTTDADTPVVAATTASDQSNPFARP